MTRKEIEDRGRKAEALAAWYLRFKGWRILGRRVKTHHGEIDLIARRGKIVSFVEVKWRQSKIERDRALYNELLRRVATAAEAVSSKYVKNGDDMRIDAILLAPRALPRHLENVWQP